MEIFYEEEVAKCIELNWQTNSKLNGLILLIDAGIKASRILELNPNIAKELIDAAYERSTACLVIHNSFIQYQ